MFQIILILLIGFLGGTDLVKEVALEFHELDGEKSELAFTEQYKNNTDPAIKAYVIAIQMKQIEYLYNPIKQMNLFSDYKKKLSSLAEMNKGNIHVRYIRLLIQEQTPEFLGYKSDIPADKAFLSVMLNSKDETDYLDKYIIESTSL